MPSQSTPETAETPNVASRSLLDLPVELLTVIVALAVPPLSVAEKDPETGRSTFKTRVAIESTCRLLRAISFGLKWFENGILTAQGFETLLAPSDKDRKIEAMRVFYFQEHRRFRGVTGLGFPHNSPKTVAVEMLEAAREGLKSSDTPDALPKVWTLFVGSFDSEIFECLRKGWQVKNIFFSCDSSGLGAATPDQIIQICQANNKDLETFTFIVEDEGEPDQQGLESIFHSLLRGLESCKNLGLLQLAVGHAQECRDKISIDFRDIARAAPKLEVLQVDQIFVTAPSAPIVPLPNLIDMRIRNTPCTCVEQPENNFFVSKSAFENCKQQEPLFPHLETLVLIGYPDDLEFGKIHLHCPKLKALKFFCWSENLDARRLPGEHDDFVKLLRGGLEQLVITVVPSPSEDQENPEFGDDRKIICLGFELYVLTTSNGKCRAGWSLGDEKPVSFLALAMKLAEEELEDGGDEEEDGDEDEEEAMEDEEDEEEDGSELEWEDVSE